MLALLLALGIVLVLVVRVPPRPRGSEAVRGHRVFAVAPASVQGVAVTIGGRRFSAHQTGGAWEIDGMPAVGETADALIDLVETLTHLRAIDAFRPRGDDASFGLAPPHGTIDLATSRGMPRLLLGTTNAAGATLYARRVRDPRILQVGTLLLSQIERVFYRLRMPQGAREAGALSN